MGEEARQELAPAEDAVEKTGGPGGGKVVVEPSPEDVLWFALHTKPRCEKKLAEWLKRAEIEHYLPTRKSIRVYPSKKIAFEVPLFPGYIFARFAVFQRRLVAGSDYAANVLFVADQAKFLNEMEQVRRLVDLGEELEPHEYLKVGKKVRVASGHMKGIEGIVEQRKGKHLLVISVEMFQQSVCVEIDPRLLRPAI